MPVKRCEVCGKGFTQGRGRPSRRCPAHRQGGGKYGGAHKRLVATTKNQAYGTVCVRCGRVMLPGQDIHLDHADGGGPADYRGWAHAHCNTSAGASKGNRMRGSLNGRLPPARVPVVAVRPPKGPNPNIEHRADCQCRELWTSRCW
jgi:hypothetical protein